MPMQGNLTRVMGPIVNFVHNSLEAMLTWLTAKHKGDGGGHIGAILGSVK